jgi:hypothetical protein
VALFYAAADALADQLARVDAQRFGQSPLRLEPHVAALLSVNDRDLRDVRAPRQLTLTERLVNPDLAKSL